MPVLGKRYRNIRFALRLVAQCCPAALVLMGMSIPVSVLISVCEVYMPRVAVAIVCEPLSGTLWQFALLGAALIALYALRGAVNARLPALSSRICTHIRYLRTERILRCDYECLERDDFRFLMQRALEATWQTDGSAAVDGLPRTLASLMANIACYVAIGSLLLMLNPLILAILTITPVAHYLLARRMQRVIAVHKREASALDRKLDYISRKGQDTAFQKDIRVFGMREWLISLYDRYSARHRHLDRKVARTQALIDLADGALILLLDGAAYALLISMFIKGGIVLPELVMYFTSIAGFATWVGGVMDDIVTLERKCEYVSDLNAFCDYALDGDSPDAKAEGAAHSRLNDGERTPLHLPDGAPRIELRHVSYTYPGADHPQIDNLSLTIEPGMRLAIVGLNGAGKTTLIKLICGLIRPDNGDVLIDGSPLAAYGARKFELFSAVMQDFHIFPLTVLQNVTCAPDGEMDDARLKAALDGAGILDMVSALPHGAQTSLAYQLSADAVELSGGQRQRIALARAIYRDAPILLLDEPTAALDAIAEAGLYQEYARLTRGKTSVFVSHRLASTRFCDSILLLKDGRVAEQGTHGQLMRMQGEYAQLYARQASYYVQTNQKAGGASA